MAAKADSRSSTSLQSLIRRHRRARRAYLKAFWVLFDHPSVNRPSFQAPEWWSAGGPSFGLFGRPVRNHAELDLAAEKYIAYSRKRGKWAFSATMLVTPKFDAASLREYRGRLPEYHSILDERMKRAREANIASGHCASWETFQSAMRKKTDARMAMERHVEMKASAAGIGLFANYILAAYNHDFSVHLSERDRRKGPEAQQVEFFRLLDDVSDCDIGLRTVQKAMTRLGGARRPARRAAA